MLEVRRHNGIMAFKSPDGFKAAFHTQNLETAEITEELWQAMAPPSASIDLSNSTLFLETELALQYWERDSREPQEPSQGINAPHFHIQNITINVTQICNLHCTYCAAGGDGSYGDPIKKISLELGGNAAAYIDESADIGLAAKKCAVGAFVNSGQVCISLQRIYAAEKIYDAFCEALKAEVAGLKLGNPLDDDVFLGPLVNEDAAIRAENWVASAVSEGALS